MFLTILTPILGIAHTKYSMFKNAKVYMACNLNCSIETKGLLNLTGCHVHCESFSISEMVQDIDLVTTEP